MNRSDVMLRTADKEVLAEVSSKNIADFSSVLVGKILTVIDASVTDREQREAMKSLIKQNLWSTVDIFVQWMSEQNKKSGNSSTFPF